MLDKDIDWNKAKEGVAGNVWAQAEENLKVEREFYGKLAEWGERGALVLLVSLVIQQLLNSPSVTFVLLALIPTALTYALSYYWLKKSKPF